MCRVGVQWEVIENGFWLMLFIENEPKPMNFRLKKIINCFIFLLIEKWNGTIGPNTIQGRFLIWQRIKRTVDLFAAAVTEQKRAKRTDIITLLTCNDKWQTSLSFKFPITFIEIINELENKTKGGYNAATLIPSNKTIKCCFYTNKCLIHPKDSSQKFF